MKRIHKIAYAFLIYTVILIFRGRKSSSSSSPRTHIKKQGHFAFMSSSYFYPKSESLGENSLALIFAINALPSNVKLFQAHFSSDQIVIFAENGTHDITTKTKLQPVVTQSLCQLITVFASAQLLPNVQRISLVSGSNKTLIPFTTPNPKKRDVVFCIAPLFVSESWQNFLFAVHIYKHFGAHTHLYLMSAVISFYSLMKEYEKEDFITIQPWVDVNFPGIDKREFDWRDKNQFRNQASSQSDCLLQYKESASFVGFIDLDDILIPKVAPTYIQEFQHFMEFEDSSEYLLYDKQNYKATTVMDGSKFSFMDMLKSLELNPKIETGKMITPPSNMNATSIHTPASIGTLKKVYHVKNNTLVHLKEIDLVSGPIPNTSLPTFLNSSDLLISENDTSTIEMDMKKMLHKPAIKEILRKLPTKQFYGEIIRKCYHEKFHKLYYAGSGDVTCTGPFLCEYKQRPDIQCIHVNAKQMPMPRLYPFTFYYATDPYFTQEIGCYP